MGHDSGCRPPALFPGPSSFIGALGKVTYEWVGVSRSDHQQGSVVLSLLMTGELLGGPETAAETTPCWGQMGCSYSWDVNPPVTFPVGLARRS